MTDGSAPNVRPVGTELRSATNDRSDRVRCAQEKAERAAERAARASAHAAQARANAERDSLQGNAELEAIHRGEAALHEQAARHHSEAAELHRAHAAHLEALDHRGNHRHDRLGGRVEGSVPWPAATAD